VPCWHGPIRLIDTSASISHINQGVSSQSEQVRATYVRKSQSALLFALLVLIPVLISQSPATTLPHYLPSSSRPRVVREAGSLPSHDFWENLWQWLNQILRPKRNLLQELVGSVTDRFALAQQVYAAGPHTVTTKGNAQIDTSQSKFGGASGRFNGSGDYLSTPNSTDWNFGTGDFTVDCWVRRNGNTNYWGLAGASSSPTPNRGWDIAFNNANQIYVASNASGTWQVDLTSSTTVANLAWTHVAVVRSGNTLTIYFDGTSVGTKNVTGYNYDSAGLGLAIARIYVDYDGYYFSGWIDEYRISKGFARWTRNFAVPTSAYTSDSYTVLLLHMDGANGSTNFVDSSGPSGPDFSLAASPSSQSVGAGATASYTLSLAALNGYDSSPTTINLSVNSGCPSGVTCSISPNSMGSSSLPATAALSVPTLITTPAGTTSIIVTATDGTLTHQVSVGLTVSGAGSYPFAVRAGATQVVVTVSWTGTGTASVTIAGPSGNPTLSESGAVVYDRISYVSGSSTPTNIHRVAFTLSSPPTGTWTAYVSLSGSYTVTIEVS